MKVQKVALTRGVHTKVQPYLDALTAVGLEPADLTPEDNPDTLEGFGGLVLAGGSDIEASRYDQPNITTHNPDRARDEMELRLLAEALERNIPVLAICRGHQLLNVALAGTLVQDLATGLPHGKGSPDHRVEVVTGSRLAGILGVAELEVNSRHHQALGEVAKPLRVVATAADGTVEGVEMPGKRFVIGVQWHPEDRVAQSEPDRRLFQAFADAVRA
jgi:putative glutamine amidotransferase